MSGLQFKLKYLICATLGVVALIYPKSTEKFRMITPRLLELKISKTSPALAILEDEKIPVDYSSTSPDLRERLASGINFDFNKIKNAAEPSQSQQYVVMQQNPVASARRLGGLTVKKDSPNVIQLKKSLGIHSHVIQYDIVKNQTQNEDSSRPTKLHESEVLNIDDFTHLSPQLKNRLAEAEGLSEALDEALTDEYPEESFEDLANAALEEYDKGAIVATVQQKEFASSLTPIEDAQRVANNFANNRIVQNKAAVRKPIKNANTTPTKNSDASESLFDQKLNQAFLAGNVELKGGLALGADSRIQIYRKIAGTIVSEGQFKVAQGRYEMYIENPNTGTIVAELWAGEELLGKGEVLIPEILRNSHNNDDLKNAHIIINPLTEEILAEVLSGYSTDQSPIPVFEADVTINDSISMLRKKTNILKQNLLTSSLILKSKKQNHWGNICIGSSKQYYKPKLYHDDTVAALYSLNSQKIDKEADGVIWGEVKIKGSHVASAQVELISRETLKPIYFNSFIPDMNLQATSENGQFAFIGLTPGSYILRAKYRNKYLAPQVVQVESGFVSQVAFDVEKVSLSEAFVFDIQTSEMLDAQLNFLGLDESHEIKGGRKLISFSGNTGLQFLEVTPNNNKYASTRITVDKSQKEILIPMVPQAWLEELFTRLKTNFIPDSALIMGLAQENPYTVEMDASGYNEDTKVLYFDDKGNWIQGATQTPKGGGFLISNVSPGIRTLFVKYANKKDQKVHTVVADSSAINVMSSSY